MSSLQIVHIGGRGGFGPVGALLDQFKSSIELYVIEADMSDSQWSTYSSRLSDESAQLGFPLYLVPACISNSERDATFYLNEEARSSSIYPPEPKALDYVRWASTRAHELLHWEKDTTPQQEIPIRTTTLDILHSGGVIPRPDVLSMDIQGSEYDALQGARSILSDGGVLAVITEAEFRPLYQGQGLFGDICHLLSRYGLYFHEFFLLDCMWNEFITRDGAPVVCEALFLCDYHNIEDIDSLFKLAAIAYAYPAQASYGFAVSSKAIALGGIPGVQDTLRATVYQRHLHWQGVRNRFLKEQGIA